VVSRHWIRRLFARWRLAWKRINYKVVRRGLVCSHSSQPHKYTVENIERYCLYLAGLQQIDLTRVKFLDEAHFRQSSKFSLALRLMSRQAVANSVRGHQPEPVITT